MYYKKIKYLINAVSFMLLEWNHQHSLPLAVQRTTRILPFFVTWLVPAFSMDYVCVSFCRQGLPEACPCGDQKVCSQHKTMLKLKKSAQC